MTKEKTGSAPLENMEIYELHEMRLKWFEDKNCSPSQIMAFLSSEFVGSLVLCGYSEEFVKKTFDMMYEKFKSHPLHLSVEATRKRREKHER